MKYLILMLSLCSVSAMAITVGEARTLAKVKVTKYDKEIEKAAKAGKTSIEFKVECGELSQIRLKGFHLISNGCAPYENGGVCSCVVSWGVK